ncbi:MAG: class I SAM-dependent methyltransferase [Candidatus Omnitrophota bacterium]
MGSDMQAYYEEEYKDSTLEADLKRKDRLAPYFPSDMKGKKILSLGSGPGVDIISLVSGNEVHAVDISREVLKIAESNGYIVHEADLNLVTRLPFEDESFDIVIATDILEHLFHLKKILFEIHRVLRKEGFAVLSVPNHFYLSRRFAILFGEGLVLPFHKSNEWDYFHIRFFTLKGWEKLLKECNFTIHEKLYHEFVHVPRGLPYSIDKEIGKLFPTLFSRHFLCKVKK